MLLATGASWGQYSVRVSSGTTGFTGENSNDDGIVVGSVGSFTSTVGLTSQLHPNIALDVDFAQGDLALNTANRLRERSTFNSLGATVRIQATTSETQRLRPYLGIGFALVGQAVHYDATDNLGRHYHNWSDGRVYDRPEDGIHAQGAQELTVDYVYESKTPFIGSLSFPIKAGVDLLVTDRVSATLAMTMFTGPEAMINPRPGMRDWITTAQAGIGILIGKPEQENTELPVEFIALGDDADGDGVKDTRDHCGGTPAGAPIDRHGCPRDTDDDGIADYEDIEVRSPHTRVNASGRALSDEEWAEALANEMSENDLTAFEKDYKRMDSPGAVAVISHSRSAHQTTEFALAEELRSHVSEGTVDALDEAVIGYRVQLGRFSGEIDTVLLGQLIDLGSTEMLSTEDGTVRFVSKAFESEADARLFLEAAKTGGILDAFVVGQRDGKFVQLADMASE
jgi:hypothetical protein